MAFSGEQKCGFEKMESRSLFPISEGNKTRTPSSLFPAFSGEKSDDVDVSEKPTPLDWLTNSSFKPQEAVVIHQVNEAVSALRNKYDSVDSGSSSEDTDDTETKPSKRPLPPPSDDDSSDEPPTKKHKKKKKKKEKHKKKKRKHKKERSESSTYTYRDEKKTGKVDRLTEKPVPVGTPGGKVFIEGVWDVKAETAYRLDRHADANNLAYLALYKMHVARYRRHTGRGALGLPPNEVLQLEGTKKKDRKNYNGEPRYFHEIKGKSSEKTQVVKVLGEKGQRKSRFDQRAESNPDFIQVTSDLGIVNRNVVTNPLGIYDAATERYLEGKPSVKQTAKQITNTDHEQDTTDDFSGGRILSRTAEYNKHLQEHPNDIDKWLEFVDFQDEAITDDINQPASNPEGATHKKKPSRLVLLEIKSAILEQAVKKNPACVGLKVRQLGLWGDQWEAGRVDQEWEQLVFAHPNDPRVWWERLAFLQTSVSLFSVSRVTKAYAKCLGTLSAIRDGTFKSHPAKPHLEEHILLLFGQYVRVLRQTGHTEKATALLQATTELNLFCPDVLRTASRADKLQFLESFWDSAAPRSGETGALGFATWIERKGNVPFCSMYSQEAEVSAEDAAIAGVASRSEGWASLESSRARRHVFPWRPDSQQGETEEDCEDLERLVMLDDVSPCVVLFTSPLCRLGLVNTYLHSLGLRLGPGDLSTDRAVQRTLRYGLENLTEISPGLRVDTQDLYSHPSEVVFQTAINLLVQVQTTKFFSGHAATYVNLALMEVRKGYLGYKQTSGCSGKDWKALCKETRKHAKSVLKEEENRNNLLLWEQYVELEWALGSADDAHRVLYTALSMTPTPQIADPGDDYHRCVTCKLYRHYAEVSLGLYVPSLDPSQESPPAGGGRSAHSEKQALYVLTSLADCAKFIPPENSNVSTPPTQILRARNAYQTTLEILLLRQGDKTTWSHAEVLRVVPQAGTLLAHWTTCFALFQYLTLGVSAGVAVLERVEERLAALSASSSPVSGSDLYTEDQTLYYHTVHQDLTNTHMRLLHAHMAAKVVPASLLRGPLQRSLQAHPDSPLLLHLYTSLEARTNIVGRLRRHLLGLTAACRTPLVWVYGTLADMTRREVLEKHAKQVAESDADLPAWLVPTSGPVGSRHQLRAWLERAVSHHTGQHSVLLWRLYFHFEVGEGDLRRAKSVYYRGIAECPAAKALCVDYVRAVPSALQEVTDFMLEKELRLRTPLEEVDLLLPAYKPRPQPQEEASDGDLSIKEEDFTQDVAESIDVPVEHEILANKTGVDTTHDHQK